MSKYPKPKGGKPQPATKSTVTGNVHRGGQAAPAESPVAPASGKAQSSVTKPADAVAATFEPGTTLQQQRAAFALKHVQGWVSKEVGVRKKLNSYAAKMPFMVHANGLGQTAAFYRAKGEKDPHHDLYRLLGAWLTRADQPFVGKTDLLDGITSTDLHTYMAAQAEAMLFLSWVKQFAAAFLESE